MKSPLLLILLVMVFSVFQLNAQSPSCEDLRETDKYQRRDLSIPGSRLIVNFYNFQSSKTPLEYSNRPTMPLNVAYLSTRANDSLPLKDPIIRFSRQIEDLLTIYKSTGSFEYTLRDDQSVAHRYETQWMPHELPFSADYSGDVKLNGYDFFFDKNTLVRIIRFSGPDTEFYLSGSIHGSIYEYDQAIVCNHNQINYAIRINGKMHEVGFRNDKWYAKINTKDYKNEPLVISIAFAEKKESRDTLLKRSSLPFSADLNQIRNSNKAFWDDLMAKVPEPANFNLETVDPMGVKPEDLYKAYYKAWVFTAMNLLDPDNELYPYPQICTGKPSLWSEGDEYAPFSAAWESFLGIQYYAYIDPDVAWQTFKGLMSLVGEDGMLGGESLPSRKAQTAMILYQLTGDIESLRETYPALKRYMDWRLNITHWVYRDIKPSIYNKDAEFAFSALVDMEHLQNIASILSYKKDVKYWKNKYDDLLNKSYSWFWETPDSMPCQVIDLKTGKRTSGNTIWTCSGLYVSGIKGRYEKSLLARFDRDFDPEKPFANFRIPKYPDISYAVYGLLQRGYEQRAKETIEANLRDIVRAHASFAEQYIGEDFKPDGVRPSLFGSSTVIDFVMLMNGYKYDCGVPQAIILKNEPAGVKNILFRKKRMELETDAQSKTISYKNDKSENVKTMKVPLNKVVTLK